MSEEREFCQFVRELVEIRRAIESRIRWLSGPCLGKEGLCKGLCRVSLDGGARLRSLGAYPFDQSMSARRIARNNLRPRGKQFGDYGGKSGKRLLGQDQGVIRV